MLEHKKFKKNLKLSKYKAFKNQNTFISLTKDQFAINFAEKQTARRYILDY